MRLPQTVTAQITRHFSWHFPNTFLTFSQFGWIDGQSITLHHSYLEWLKYKTDKPLLYTVYSEWVSSFLTAHQHIIGYFSALQWCEYRDKIVEI